MKAYDDIQQIAKAGEERKRGSRAEQASTAAPLPTAGEPWQAGHRLRPWSAAGRVTQDRLRPEDTMRPQGNDRG